MLARTSSEKICIEKKKFLFSVTDTFKQPGCLLGHLWTHKVKALFALIIPELSKSKNALMWFANRT